MKKHINILAMMACIAIAASCAPKADELIDRLETAYEVGDQATVTELSEKLAKLTDNGKLTDEQTVRIEYLAQKFAAAESQQNEPASGHPADNAGQAVEEETVISPADSAWINILDAYESTVVEYLAVAKAGQEPEGQTPENIEKGAQLMERIDSLTMVIENGLANMNDDLADRYSNLVLKFTNSIASE